MKYWSRAVALSYLMFMLGSLASLEGRPFAPLIGAWTLWDITKIAIALLATLAIGYFAGTETQRSSHNAEAK